MGSVVSKVIRRRTSRYTPQVKIKRPPVPKPVEGKGSVKEEVLHQPDKELLGRLKDVYVSSSESSVEKENTYASERKPFNLPQDRHAFYEDPLEDPEAAPPGYLTIKDLTRILQHQEPWGREVDKSDKWSPERIVQVYGISQEDAENLLKYFTGYKVVGTLKKPIPEMKYHSLNE